MSNGAVVTFAPSIFERDHLFVFKLVQDLAGNSGSLDKWRSGGEAVAIPVQNHFVKCDLVAGGCRELFDRNGISRANPILLTSRTNDCVCHGDLPRKAPNISQETVFPNQVFKVNAIRHPPVAS